MRFTSLAGCYSFQLSGYSRYRFSPWQNDSHTRASRNERGWRKKGKKQTRYIVENTRSRSMPRRGANQSRDSGSILSIDLLPFVLPSEHPPFLPLCLFHPSPLPMSGENGQSRKSQPKCIPHDTDFLRSTPVGSRPPNVRSSTRGSCLPRRDTSRTMIFRQVGDRSMRIFRNKFVSFVSSNNWIITRILNRNERYFERWVYKCIIITKKEIDNWKILERFKSSIRNYISFVSSNNWNYSYS